MINFKINFAKNNSLVPVIIQDVKTGEILMQAFQNRIAYKKTLTTKEVYFFSRTRNELWKKGATSGNVFKVIEILTDCDSDAILIKVVHNPALRACHTGARTCFHTKIL